MDKFARLLDKERDGGEDGIRETAQRLGEKEEHHQDNGGRRHMGPLTAATRAVYYGSLGGTAVNNEGAATTGGSVGQRETDQIDILTEVVTITESVRARGGSALSEDDNETGESNGKDRSNIVPRNIGQA